MRKGRWSTTVHAKELSIDPHRIGVIGFSAGGHLAAAMSTHFTKRLYKPVDAADRESCRPDFAVAIYPGHLSFSAAEWDAKRGKKKYVVPNPEHLSATQKQLAIHPIYNLPLRPRRPSCCNAKTISKRVILPS